MYCYYLLIIAYWTPCYFWVGKFAVHCCIYIAERLNSYLHSASIYSLAGYNITLKHICRQVCSGVFGFAVKATQNYTYHILNGFVCRVFENSLWNEVRVLILNSLFLFYKNRNETKSAACKPLIYYVNFWSH